MSSRGLKLAVPPEMQQNPCLELNNGDSSRSIAQTKGRLQQGAAKSCLVGQVSYMWSLLGTNPPRASKDKFEKHMDDMLDVGCLVLVTITLELQKQHEGGYQYFIMFTEDFSRYGYIYLMRHKSEALKKFKEFKNEVQNQHGKSIKALRSDRGGEYLSQDFDELLKNCGIVSQLTPPGTPQWNGVSERRN
ncbi:hypothetical protein V6N11_080380 [Hibiscus sabdariffa]|uniref:Integrase catalytic domain-containing protein n=1 Tax=Hibiscus sabdariffa TaxID=183260 RepID=A0ABR2R815_9ROSI